MISYGLGRLLRPVILILLFNIGISTALIAADIQKGSIAAISGLDNAANTAIGPSQDFRHFLNNHIAVKIRAGLTKHDFMTAEKGMGGVHLGTPNMLPSEGVIQFHLDSAGKLSPYLGFGVGQAYYYDRALPGDGFITGVRYNKKAQMVLEAGASYPLKKGINLDAFLKRIAANNAQFIGMNGNDLSSPLGHWAVGLSVGFDF